MLCVFNLYLHDIYIYIQVKEILCTKTSLFLYGSARPPEGVGGARPQGWLRSPSGSNRLTTGHFWVFQLDHSFPRAGETKKTRFKGRESQKQNQISILICFGDVLFFKNIGSVSWQFCEKVRSHFLSKSWAPKIHQLRPRRPLMELSFARKRSGLSWKAWTSSGTCRCQSHLGGAEAVFTKRCLGGF